MNYRFFPLIAVIASLQPALAEENWISLFDGESLKGWVQHNGTALYEVKDGSIVGTTAEGSPNSFLCTEKSYADFELEFEVLVHDQLNSGVQIRSQQREKEDPTLKGGTVGRVNGPQVEIESSPGQSGWIFGEGTGKGWLSPEPKSEDESVNQHSHMKNGEWNQYRVIAQGPRIQTFINGQPVADLTHEEIYQTHSTGFIGLQVHSIQKGQGPFTVAWRNLRIRELEAK